jgi:hypothetical protein
VADDEPRDREPIVSSQEKAGLALLLSFASRNDLILSQCARYKREFHNLSPRDSNILLEELYATFSAHVAQLRSFLRNRDLEDDFLREFRAVAKKNKERKLDAIAGLLELMTVVGSYSERAQLLTTFDLPDPDWVEEIFAAIVDEALEEELYKRAEKEQELSEEIEEL